MNSSSRLRLRNALLALLGTTFLIGVFWRLTGWHERVNFAKRSAWPGQTGELIWTAPAVMAAYIVAGLFLFMHAALLWATVFAFDPWYSAFYCELGSIASALCVY